MPTTGTQTPGGAAVRYAGPGWAGVLSTASGVVFGADHQGTFMAVDAASGTVLYRHGTGGNVFAAPTTYLVDGRQYVALPSATTVTAFTVR